MQSLLGQPHQKLWGVGGGGDKERKNVGQVGPACHHQGCAFPGKSAVADGVGPCATGQAAIIFPYCHASGDPPPRKHPLQARQAYKPQMLRPRGGGGANTTGPGASTCQGGCQQVSKMFLAGVGRCHKCFWQVSAGVTGSHARVHTDTQTHTEVCVRAPDSIV